MLSTASCLQWCMDLVVEASEEELVQLKVEAEVEMGKLIDTYHQVCSLIFIKRSLHSIMVCAACEQIGYLCWPAACLLMHM